MEITRGKLQRPQKVVVYGPEGIGKSTFASLFPDPLFIDTEGSTIHLDVARTPAPSSWTMLMNQLEWVKINRPCRTLVLDTGDWAEKLCKDHVCSVGRVQSIEDFGYGKGYTKLMEVWGTFLNKLTEIIDAGMNVVITAHAQMRKFEQPEETGAYDRWELKLEKKTAPLTKEWADMILFANYEILVVNVDNQGAAKGKNKARGGKRVMYTQHNPSWDAKNRHDLDEKLDFDFGLIAHIFQGAAPAKGTVQAPAPVARQEAAVPEVTPESEGFVAAPEVPDLEDVFNELNNIPKALKDLMIANEVTVSEIQEVVGKKGYFPQNTPIENYPLDFVNGVLVSAWNQVFEAVKENRDDIPF